MRHKFGRFGVKRSLIVVTIFLLSAMAYLPGPAIAATGDVSEFPIPTVFSGTAAIAAGPDGNLWFTEFYGKRIGRITPTGQVTEFPLPPAVGGPIAIAAGPDGNLWYTHRHFRIGRITPTGQVTEFPLPTTDSIFPGIAAGPDSNLWFTEQTQNRIGRITPTGQITEYLIPTPNGGPQGIAAGPDGNIWFTLAYRNRIGRITPTGQITEFPTLTPSSEPHSITAGPDGNLWFTVQSNESVGRIGRITPTGQVTEFPIPTASGDPEGIAEGPDGNLWFTLVGGNRIGRITPTGQVSEFLIPTPASGPAAITAGPDGNLWVALVWGNRIGRIEVGATRPASIGAWGDSYISGEGAPHPQLGYLVGTNQPNNRCHRSSLAFPALIAKRLHRELNFHACSGAVIRDYVDPFALNHDGRNVGEPAQRATVTRQNDIGFLSLGGNNIGFKEVMTYCSTRARYEPTCEQRFGARVNQRLKELRKSGVLVDLYRDLIFRMAPGARLYVTGYPRFFPVRPPSSCWTGALLPQRPVFIRSDMVWINSMISEFVVIARHAASRVPGARFIDMYDTFDGHELCNLGSKESWLNRINRDLSESFHPNVKGHQAEAEWIMQRMR